MNIKVYELKIKLYILKDIPVDDMLSIESDYIDSALALSDEWLHTTRTQDIRCIRTMAYILLSVLVYIRKTAYTR